MTTLKGYFFSKNFKKELIFLNQPIHFEVAQNVIVKAGKTFCCCCFSLVFDQMINFNLHQKEYHYNKDRVLQRLLWGLGKMCYN